MVIIVFIYVFIAVPFNLFSSNTGQRQFTKWTSPKDDWNIASLPRSIVPHLKPRNGTHVVPEGRPVDEDEEFLQRLKALKVRSTLYL